MIGLATALYMGNALAQDDEEPKAYTYATYLYCDVGKEEAADKVMKRFAPVMDKLVDDGAINAWGWQTHIIGGKVRKLQTMTAKDLPTLLAARAESIESMYPDDSAMGREFAEICGTHVDYIWNNELGK